jgi:hypothetical protein
MMNMKRLRGNRRQQEMDPIQPDRITIWCPEPEVRNLCGAFETNFGFERILEN